MSKRNSEDEIQPYDAEPRLLDENLFIWDGAWHGSPFGRRMTIARMQSGGLFIHNAMRMHEAGYAILDRLGPVELIVVPNRFHDSDAHHYKRRYPQARLHVPPSALQKISKLCEVDGVLPPLPGEAWLDEIACLEFMGTRYLEEYVFLVRESRTLILTDLVFNMPLAACEGSRIKTALFKCNRLYDRFGPSNLFKHVFLNNRGLASRSLEKVLEWDFDRVIMNHGTPLETGGPEALRKGFSEIGVSARA